MLQRIALMLLLACAVASKVVAADSADRERGAKLFKQCVSCHKVGPKARNGVGPHLNGVFGRRAGSVEGFRYSQDIRRAGVTGMVWTADKLDVYIENPQALVSGTRMMFRGVKDPQDRRDVIAYLRRFSDNPRDIPEAAPTAEHAVAPEILTIRGDPEYGEYLSGECVTCHQPGGEDKGIPSIVGWPSDVFVIAMHAYRDRVRDSPVMQLIAEPLANEDIAALAAYFAQLRP